MLGFRFVRFPVFYVRFPASHGMCPWDAFGNPFLPLWGTICACQQGSFVPRPWPRDKRRIGHDPDIHFSGTIFSVPLARVPNNLM